MKTAVDTMPADHAEWIREHVWPKSMRKTFAECPGFYLKCDCQFSATTWCQTDRHARCHRATPLRSYETLILKSNGTHPAAFKEPFFHRTPTATGGHRMRDAQVWLADRVCRWLCPCTCHGQPAERIPSPVQLDLFGST